MASYHSIHKQWFNARSGAADQRTVFERDDEDSVNTDDWRELLREHGLCLPSTRTSHCGQDANWFSPDGLLSSRIDFVAIRQSQLEHRTYSATLPDFDLGNPHFDHVATGIQIDWQEALQLSRPNKVDKPGRAYNRAHLRALGHDLPLGFSQQAPWSCDVEKQLDNLKDELHSSRGKVARPASSAPKKPYIDSLIWDLRSQKLRIKRAIRACGQALKKSSSCYDEVHRAAVEERRIELGARLKSVSHELRSCLKTSKNKALQKHLEELDPHLPSSLLLKDLKPFIGPANLKKAKKCALPMIKTAAGNLASTPEESLSAWIAHFGKIEGGRRVTMEQLRADWISALQREVEGFECDLECLPSLTHLEAAFRRVRPGKATGPDGLPSDFFSKHARTLAKQFYAIMVKIMSFGHEPLAWKGGYMIAAYKGRGSMSDPTGYRSLLISDHCGKAVHRAIRQGQLPFYLSHLHPGQVGGRPYMPVGVGLHIVRSFARFAKSNSLSAAVLFLDLKEAFHRVIRQLAAQVDEAHLDLGTLGVRFGLEESAIADLHRLILERSAVQEAQLPAPYQSAIAALHSQTWFRFRNQTDLVATTHGSRPGDSFADILFGLSTPRFCTVWSNN